VTARLRAHVPNWRQISALDDDAVAAMIRADGIDILVDLSGHTSGNRLLVFARKPAPVQVTWLGYCNTSGLGNMDYLLADAGVIPPDTTQRFSEQVLRLRAVICVMWRRIMRLPWCRRPVSPAVMSHSVVSIICPR